MNWFLVIKLDLFFGQGGVYLLTLVDQYSAGYPLMIVSFTELTAVMYIYGMVYFSHLFENVHHIRIP